jgi:hypothetical protein
MLQQLNRAGVVTNAQAEKEIKDAFPDPVFAQLMLENSPSIKPEQDKIRVLCLVRGGHRAPCKVECEADLILHLKMNPPLSTCLAQNWEQKFAEAVESGNGAFGRSCNYSIS